MRTVDYPKNEVARQLSNLSSVQNLQGKGVTAEQSANEAFALLEKNPTDDQLQLAILKGNLGKALLLQDKIPESKKLFLEELKILEAINQSDSHFAASANIGLGAIEAKLGNLKKAKALYDDALRVFLQISDENHPITRMYIAELKQIEEKLNAQQFTPLNH